MAAAAIASYATPTAAAKANQVQLQHDPNRRLFRVRTELEVEGNVELSKNSLTSKKRARQLPVKATSVLDYEERLERSGAVAIASERYYYEAQSTGKLAGTENGAELRDNARRIIVHSGNERSVSYAQSEYLTHQEIDLLRLPANSLAMDDLLPREPVAAGDKYKVASQSLRRLLDLDAIQESDVIGELVSVDQARAQMQIKGNVQGSVDGVATSIDIAAKLVFDRQQRASTWLAMAMREKRDIGKAEPGFEVAATLKMIRKPLTKPNAIHRPAKIALSGPPEERLLVELTSKRAGFGTLMDRRWRIVSETPGLVTMRMTDSDRSIAQCDIRPLGALKAGEQLTLEALQADVRDSLGKQFGEFLQAEEKLNSSGLRILQISGAGSVEQIPMHWIFIHCSDDSGRRVLATFTLEAEKVSDFSGADVQFSGAVHFL
ncbi:MAG: hypothetical protein WD119_01955, partial [Pirellulaceae bacterium]